MISLNELKQCINNCKKAGDKVSTRNGYVKAAVMVIFTFDFIRQTNQLILIKRKKNLRKHAGQLAFPGGRYEKSDKNLLETAFRETK